MNFESVSPHHWPFTLTCRTCWFNSVITKLEGMRKKRVNNVSLSHQFCYLCEETGKLFPPHFFKKMSMITILQAEEICTHCLYNNWELTSCPSHHVLVLYSKLMIRKDLDLIQFSLFRLIKVLSNPKLSALCKKLFHLLHSSGLELVTSCIDLCHRICCLSEESRQLAGWWGWQSVVCEAWTVHQTVKRHCSQVSGGVKYQWFVRTGY